MAAMGKEHTAAGTDDHREDGDGVGMDIENIETLGTVIA
jgi:hypothetical protein